MRGIFESNTRKQQHHYQSAKPLTKTGGGVFVPYDQDWEKYGGIEKDGIIYNFPGKMAVYFPGLGDWEERTSNTGDDYFIFDEGKFNVQHAGYNPDTDTYGLLLKAPNAKTETALFDYIIDSVTDPEAVTRRFRGAATDYIEFTGKSNWQECKTPLALPIYDIYIYREAHNPTVETSAYCRQIKQIFDDHMAQYQYEEDHTITEPDYNGASQSLYQWATERLNQKMGLPAAEGFYLPEGAEFAAAVLSDSTSASSRTPRGTGWANSGYSNYCLYFGVDVERLQTSSNSSTVTLTGAQINAKETYGDGSEAFYNILRSYYWPPLTSVNYSFMFGSPFQYFSDATTDPTRYDTYILYGFIFVLKGFDLVAECSLNQAGRGNR